MNVRMTIHALSPGMEDHHHPTAQSKMFLQDAKQCLGNGFEEKPIDRIGILQDEGNELMRNREDEMQILGGKIPAPHAIEPGTPRGTSTGWTMPVAAGVVAKGSFAAHPAVERIASELRSPAGHQPLQDLFLAWREPDRIPGDHAVGVPPQHIRDRRAGLDRILFWLISMAYMVCIV
jgi:hypothetical protein